MVAKSWETLLRRLRLLSLDPRVQSKANWLGMAGTSRHNSLWWRWHGKNNEHFYTRWHFFLSFNNNSFMRVTSFNNYGWCLRFDWKLLRVFLLKMMLSLERGGEPTNQSALLVAVAFDGNGGGNPASSAEKRRAGALLMILRRSRSIRNRRHDLMFLLHRSCAFLISH